MGRGATLALLLALALGVGPLALAEAEPGGEAAEGAAAEPEGESAPEDGESSPEEAENQLPEALGEVLAASYFDSGDEGWKGGNYGSVTPVYEATGGNPGGYIQAPDDGAGTAYWRAPEVYRGNLSRAFGGMLSFDLRQSADTDQNEEEVEDVCLEGGNFQTLYVTLPEHPGTDWTHYEIPLDETGGWLNQGSGAPASQIQLLAVLNSVFAVQIRAEFSNLPDETNALDNVVLCAAGSQAEGTQMPPSAVSYSGTLYAEDGITPEQGLRHIEFRIYAAREEKATPLWGELHPAVPLRDGVYHVMLGMGVAIDGVPHPAMEDAFAGQEHWIAVTVAGENERGERQRFLSVPYAFMAESAVTATHGVPRGTIAGWCEAVDGPMAAGWLPCDGRSLSRSGEYRPLFQVIGTTWGEGADPPNTFNLPNFGGRVLAGDLGFHFEPGMGEPDLEGWGYNSPGEEPSSTNLQEKYLGETLGRAKQPLGADQIPVHGHGYTDHHGVQSDNSKKLTVGGNVEVFSHSQLQTSSRDSGATGGPEDGAPGSAAPHENRQPFGAVTFIIKY